MQPVFVNFSYSTVNIIHHETGDMLLSPYLVLEGLEHHAAVVSIRAAPRDHMPVGRCGTWCYCKSSSKKCPVRAKLVLKLS